MNGLEKSRNLMVRLKQYPIPIIALCGLVLGGFFHLFYNPEIGHFAWLVTLVVGGAPIIWQTVKGMLHKHFASDIVAMMAILASIILNDAFPGVIIVLMQSGGKALEDYAYKRATSSLDNLLSRAPKTAIKKDDHVLNVIDVSDIQLDDILVIRPGDLFPVDGQLLSSGANFEESSHTGEPQPRAKKMGDLAFSGTVNVGEPFVI